MRWQACLPRETSIVVSVGDASAHAGGVIGSPAGPVGGGGPVVQLRYRYSSAVVAQAAGLEALVLSGVPATEGEPDAYPLVFER